MAPLFASCMTRALLLASTALPALSLAQPFELPTYKVGDRWEFARTTSAGAQSTWSREIKEVLPDGRLKVDMGKGNVQEYDQAMNFTSKGRTRLIARYPLAEGGKWSGTGLAVRLGNNDVDEQVGGEVIGKEEVEVPAGRFNCFKVQSSIQLDQKRYHKAETYTRWYCPEIRWFAKEVVETRVNTATESSTETAESKLVKFTAGN